ncbi:protein adenylyltransferase SelO [Thalassotalea atypica]|uniref:protein adenylyltransferase SelO n=1 Tax=Thalassotalea atypica TaxID=2054316 RepID=UPI0025728FFB|nr:YdiU family protein [Thalassotalea atypica]
MMIPTLFKLTSSISEQLPFAVTPVKPTPLRDSFLLTYSRSCGDLLGLPANFWQSPEFKTVLAGEKLPKGGVYTAQVYAGHQFGQFVPQLGDGRAISIGEISNHVGESYEIQLKGSGLTPYSRMGDGRAVLRSCIREFLASEAMAALNIPTTRALSIVGSNEEVYRERVEQGAMMARVAQSHIRFGHFEYWFHRNKIPELTHLANYCIEQFYPEANTQELPYLYLFEQIVQRTATLIAQWQAHGFAHGVMNTDNMSILGLTIDYGPFGFLDDYNPGFICNHSDSSGRYAFEEQPSIGLWNLNALGLTFSTWLSVQQITTALKAYEPALVKRYLSIMRQKLGLANWQASDQQLLGQLLAIMAEQKADYTLTFRLLNSVDVDDVNNANCDALLQLFRCQKDIKKWLVTYRARLQEDALRKDERVKEQNKVNALYVLRNYLAELAIKEAESGCYHTLEKLHSVLSTPFTWQRDSELFAEKAPNWGKKLEVSCSS